MTLRNVLPVFPRSDARNGLSSDTVLSRKFFLSDVALSVLAANFGNFILGKLRNAAAFLAITVGHIVGMRTNKQMGGTHAARVVAVMTDMHIVRDGAVFQLPREAMRENAFAVNIKQPVAVFGSASCPFPTAARGILANFLPKAFVGRNTALIVPAVSLEKANRLTPYLPAFCSGLSRNRGRLSATAFAKVYRGVVRGMIRHVDTFLSRFGHAAGRFQRRCGSSISSLDYTTNGRFSLVGGKR